LLLCCRLRTKRYLDEIFFDVRGAISYAFLQCFEDRFLCEEDLVITIFFTIILILSKNLT
jgi:hypothetical protein